MDKEDISQNNENAENGDKNADVIQNPQAITCLRSPVLNCSKLGLRTILYSSYDMIRKTPLTAFPGEKYFYAWSWGDWPILFLPTPAFSATLSRELRGIFYWSASPVQKRCRRQSFPAHTPEVEWILNSPLVTIASTGVLKSFFHDFVCFRTMVF